MEAPGGPDLHQEFQWPETVPLGVWGATLRADHVERAVEAGLNISLNFAVTCRPSFESISKLPSESMPSVWPETDPPGPAANTEAMAYVVEQVAR